MPENTIYSLARTLQQTNGLEQDFSKMLSSLRDTIEKEYLLKIRSAAHSEKTFAVENPPREVTLLRAVSAFTDEKGREQIDRMTRSLLFLHTMQHIRQGVDGCVTDGHLLNARSAESTAEELPSARSAQMAGLLLALSLADQF